MAGDKRYLQVSHICLDRAYTDEQSTYLDFHDCFSSLQGHLDDFWKCLLYIFRKLLHQVFQLIQSGMEKIIVPYALVQTVSATHEQHCINQGASCVLTK